MIKRIGLVTGALLIHGCATTTTPPPERQLTARSDTKQVVGTYAFWNRDCQTRNFEIQVTTKPAHGELVFVDARHTVPARASLGEAHICTGKVVDGRRVFYQSKTGYRGPDAFAFRIDSGQHQKDFLYRVNVVP